MGAAVSMKFRPDIQGLRAVAVLGVFLFHLGVPGFGGGFVGVDVFFVISGFLITRIIAEEASEGRFSFGRFYDRRLKRILPVFQLVGLVTMAAGLVLMLPTALLELIESVIASSLYASNLYFWRETTGYFGATSDELPLLHNWSLSVEEQFYLVWPLVLVLLMRRLSWRQLPFAIVGLAAASFALAEWGAGFKASAAYFLAPTRAGEFLLGALLVFVPEGERHSRRWLNEAAGLGGLLLVIVANVALDRYSRFPGWNALWPCMGAAMVMDSGRRPESLVRRLLALRPLVYVGTLSYSIYLWHWPPIAFLHYFGIEASATQKLALFLAVIVLAHLSWRFVEERTRRVDWSLGRSILVLGALPLMLQVGAYAQEKARPPAFRGLGEVISSPARCREVAGNDHPDDCRLGDPTRPASFVLWGDSYADTLSEALDAAGKREGVSGYRYILHMCPSIAGATWDDPRRLPDPGFAQRCRRFTDRAMQAVLADRTIHTVVLNSSYNWYQTARNLAGMPILAGTHPGRSAVMEFESMLETLAAAGKRVVVVMPHPDDKDRFNAALRRAYVEGTTADLTLPLPEVDGITAMVERLATRLDIVRVYPHQLMCDARRCRVFDEQGDLYQSDGAHITSKMARRVVAQFPQDWHRPP